MQGNFPGGTVVDQLTTVFSRFGLLIALAGGGLSLVMFIFVGIQYMMAQGDPQGMAKAKSSFIGAVVGSVIVGLAFIIPGVISSVVIEPSGGTSLRVQSGEDCDGLLKGQLVVQRGANTPARINEVVRQIQNQRDACVEELWDPEVVPTAAARAAGTNKLCFAGADSSGGVAGTGGSSGTVENTLVPSGLRLGNTQSGLVRGLSGRDADNNVIVYWGNGSNTNNRPADQAECWLYVSRLQVWSESY